MALGLALAHPFQRLGLGGGPRLLDQYAGAAAGYSLSRIAAAAQYAMRVRRDSDDDELDIGFIGGDLDTVRLLDFCGVSDGLVVTAYDQSGNDRHATQTTPGNQPMVVNGGSLIAEGGRPAMLFKTLSAERYLTMSFGATIPQPWHAFSVHRIRVLPIISQASPVFDGTNLGNRVQLYKPAGGLNMSLFAGSVLQNGSANTDHTVASALFSGAGSQLYRNGTLGASGNAGTAGIEAATIGAIFNGTNGWTGTQSTLIFYSSDQSANRAAIDQSLAEYHGIALP